MISVSKSEVNEQLLVYFRIVEQTGEELIVTSNRVPILKISLLKKRKTPQEVFGDFQGKVKYHEDILSDTSNEWPEI